MDVDPGQIRFIPYVQMHEFEALLFSAPGILAEVVSRDGNLAATRIGLDIMREKCPHFNGWLSKLEALGQNYRTGK